MLIQTRTIIVKAGHADQVVENFSGESPMDTMPGLVDKLVMVNRRGKEEEEVVVMIRWESLEAWKNWEKSDAHLAMHKGGEKHTPPDFVLSTDVNMYDVKTVKKGIQQV